MSRFVSLSTFLLWCFSAGLCAAGILLSAFYLYLAPQLPEAAQLKETQLQTPLRIFTSDNKKIGEFGEKRRSPVEIELVPSTLKNAFIAAEDNRFYEHGGIDIRGLLRATTQLVRSGRIQSGGSTITMQVAKNFFLTRERTFVRKFNEIFLAIQIEQELTKDEILELYLNKIYLGNRSYGIKAAAQVYYGKTLDELSLAESAMIAGLPKAPSRYNPLANAERAKIRRNWILDRMFELQLISHLDHQSAISAPITAEYHGTSPDLSAPYVAEMARQKAVELFGSDAYTSGLNVYVTIDSELQKQAQTSIQSGLDAYDQRHGYRGPIGQMGVLPDHAIDNLISELRQFSRKTRHTAALVIHRDSTSLTLITANGEQVELTIEDAKLAAPYINVNSVGKAPKSFEGWINAGDVIEVSYSATEDGSATWSLAQTPRAQGALVSVNPNDGAIIALSGGYDFQLSKYNRATQAKRQPGSNFKAFIYLAALEEGWSASSLINDAPIVFEDKNLETAWRPENSSGRFYGPTRLRVALYNSRNLVSIRLLKAVGISATLKHIKEFGFDLNDLPKDLSLALGSGGVTPLQVATGYAMIANGGYYIEPYLVSHIEDAEGRIVYKADPLVVCKIDCETENDTEASTIDENDDLAPADAVESEVPALEVKRIAPRIADERAVFIMHSMMKDVIKKGTGRRALVLKRNDLGGKTGTTNEQRDAWFSGFNQDIATSVWVGFDTPETLGRREYGSRAALPVWVDFMAAALEGTPAANMSQPEGIVSVKIDADTGKRANYASTNTLFEIFRTENIPEEDAAPRLVPAEQSENNSSTRPEDIF